MDNTSVSSVSGKEKLFGILSYIGPLWAIGMCSLIPSNVRESAYLKNHVNNGITLFLCEVILACIPFLGWACEVVVVVFMVMGIIAAASNKYFSVPIIGEKIKFYW